MKLYKVNLADINANDRQRRNILIRKANNTIQYIKREQCTDLIQTLYITVYKTHVLVYAIKRGKISLYSKYEGYPF